MAHLLLRNQLWKNCKELGWHFFLFLDISFICHHFVNYYIKLRIFVTAEPGDNSVEMKRVLQDYLRSMRISSEVCCRLKPNGLPKPNPFLPNCFRLKLLRSKLKKLNHSWPIIRQAICSRTSSLTWKYFRPVYRIETFRAELMVKALYHVMCIMNFKWTNDRPKV